MISFGCFLMTPLLDLVVVDQRLEGRRLEDAEPDPQADPDEQDGEGKRYPPTPSGELIPGPRAERQYRKVREEQTARHAELRPRCDEAALVMVTRPFHCQQYRSAPLPTDADALDHAQKGQDHGAPNTDRLVGGNKGDQKGRDAHAQKRGDQGRLAPDAVAVMAEYRGADRAADKADEVGAERRERCGERIFVGEVELAEDQAGRGAVDEEIVPFDRGADRRGDHRLAQLRAVLRRGHCLVSGGARHLTPPPAAPHLQVKTLASS